MQTGKMFGLDFRPELTPQGVPVVTSFRIRDNPYVVDEDGTLFQLMVRGDDPEEWCWQVVLQL